MVGKLVVLEGIDGCGKSTLCSGLHETYRQRGIDTVMMTEPSKDSGAGKLLRQMLMSGIYTQDTFLHLLFADRAEQNERRVQLINEGVTIFLDRYYYSTFAYQSLRYSFKELDLHHELFKPGLVRPDLALFVEVPVEVANSRLSDRPQKSCFDACRDMIHIAANYRIMQRLSNFCFKDNIVYIDGNQLYSTTLAKCLAEVDAVTGYVHKAQTALPL
jgi:dTMP kinase